MFGKLPLHQISINSLPFQKLTMTSLLNQLPMFYDNNSITIDDG